MKYALLLWLVVSCQGNLALAATLQETPKTSLGQLAQLYRETQAAGLAPEVIAALQSRFKGRVVSIRHLDQGYYQVQLVRPDRKVVIVMMDASGAILSVRE